jgi:beta-N-acetylhexosaminidase
VNVNPANPVIGDRSFGSSPEDVARFGIAAARGYTEGGVLPVVKHFPGHGDTSVDSHLGLPLVPHGRERLERVELAPFREAFDAGVPAVMTAHVRVPALEPAPLPATFSRKILRDLLRRDMGFEGLVFSDSMGMGAIRKGWSAGEAAVLAFRAGADMLIYGADPDYSPEKVRVVRDALLAAVRSGEISRERLGESVRRILDAKEMLGLFEDPFPREEDLGELASAESVELARTIARRSLTVIRNRGKSIPVGEEGPFVILWPERLQRYLPSFREYCPIFEPLVVPRELSAEREAEIREALSDREVLFAGCFDLFRDPSLGRLLRGLPADKLVLLSFRSPYDLMQVPHAGAALALYGNTPVTLEALNGFLKGDFVPTGVLPVELPKARFQEERWNSSHSTDT